VRADRLSNEGMRSYGETVDLARSCALNARLAPHRDMAAELWQMAAKYQAEAAELNGGELPDIGSLPLWLNDNKKDCRPSATERAQIDAPIHNWPGS
jgi:hypothetical protein